MIGKWKWSVSCLCWVIAVGAARADGPLDVQIPVVPRIEPASPAPVIVSQDFRPRQEVDAKDKTERPKPPDAKPTPPTPALGSSAHSPKPAISIPPPPMPNDGQNKADKPTMPPPIPPIPPPPTNKPKPARPDLPTTPIPPASINERPNVNIPPPPSSGGNKNPPPPPVAGPDQERGNKPDANPPKIPPIVRPPTGPSPESRHVLPPFIPERNPRNVPPPITRTPVGPKPLTTNESSPWVVKVEVVNADTHLHATSKNSAFRIICQKLNLQSPAGEIQAEGNVKVTAAGLDVICDRLSISWKNDWVLMEGAVRMLTEREGQRVELSGNQLRLKLTALTARSATVPVNDNGADTFPPETAPPPYHPRVNEHLNPPRTRTTPEPIVTPRAVVPPPRSSGRFYTPERH